jgi:hypothetical protein
MKRPEESTIKGLQTVIVGDFLKRQNFWLQDKAFPVSRVVHDPKKSSIYPIFCKEVSEISFTHFCFGGK